MEERTIVLTIEYDGTAFCGWQRQPNARTVQGVLEDVLGRVLVQEVRLDGVSRTDAGVHALGQRASFSGTFGIPTDRIPDAVNHILAGRSMSPGKNGDVRIVRAEEARPGFHARYDARGKRYRYLLFRGGMPVFLRNYRYQVPEKLDLGAMRRAALLLAGTHDFAAFQAAGSYPRRSTVREIWDLKVLEKENFRDAGSDVPVYPEDLLIEVSGNGFLYHMVRNIVGTLVEVGTGRRAPEEMTAILRSRDRSRAGHTAPPQGLWLDRVYYEEDGKEFPDERERESEAGSDGVGSEPSVLG